MPPSQKGLKTASSLIAATTRATGMPDSSKPSHSAGPNPSAPIAAGRQVSKLSLSPSVTSNSSASPQGSASRTSLANPALLMGASIIHLQSATKPSAKASSEFANSPSLTQPRSTCHGWPPDSSSRQTIYCMYEHKGLCAVYVRLMCTIHPPAELYAKIEGALLSIVVPEN